LLLLSSSVLTTAFNAKEDFDPLVDLAVTVEITQIRSLEKTDLSVLPLDKIDAFSDPDFYVKVFINDVEFTSPTWGNMKYVYGPNWSAMLDVPDDVEYVNITIQLWDANIGRDRLCDISENEGVFADNYDIDLLYSLKVGHWTGEDYVTSRWGASDQSGYGRLNGCDDNSIYQNNRDCELWFDIYQTDFDGDGIPYWTEENMFHTDPTVDNIGEDADGDGIPIEWEFRWGYFMNYDSHNHSMQHAWQYDPFVWEDHASMDSDDDGLDNMEEYLTSQWGSDPFRKDLFVELDQMDAGPDGEPASILPDGSKELLRTAYNKHNIVYHLDDGSWGDSGSDMVPYDEITNMSWHSQNNELYQIYNDYFLHGDDNYWRRGVFHYGVIIHKSTSAAGAMFGSDRFYITSNGHDQKTEKNPYLLDRDIVYASAYMHECGHTLDIENPGVDDRNSMYIYQLNWWKWRPYRSVMNYGHMYQMVDYSDGSRGMNDFNDWGTLDLTAFDQSFP
ncbi:MAG: hypothetical protein KKG04_05690, partial [Candidatus Thermoplasmatota archaeon]|nr:hypothetical protein [Candidatus Thermoplasmatota archaeon]